MTAESKTYGLSYMLMTLAQAIKEYINYELKSADNPYVLTNFCKLPTLFELLFKDIFAS